VGRPYARAARWVFGPPSKVLVRVLDRRHTLRVTNFAQEIAAAAADAPDQPAVKLDDIVLNYALLDAGVARAAGMLRSKGVETGDRVGLQMPNVPYFPVVYYGVLRLGAVVVPMNPLLKGREVEYYLSDSGARLMVAWHDFAAPAGEGSEAAGAECVITKPGEFEQLLGGADPVEEVVERADDDPAVIIYTSGTTGTPKGATLMHSNLASGAEVARDLVDAGPDSVGLATLPLFHVFGMNSVMNMAVHARGLVTLLPRFEPGKALEIIQRDRVTSFAGVPTMYSALLHHPDRDNYDVSSLDLCVSGGSAMPVELLSGFDDAFGAKVLEGYGLSETTGMGSFNLPDQERKPGSIGVPIGGTEMKVVDDDGNELPQGERGEVVMRGPFVMKGYWNKPEATNEVMKDGWFHTGDIATVDEDGYFFIVDRKKELIIRGGYNVYPREIEEVLYGHPAVREAAVVGMPHDDLGEEVGAAIALKDGTEASPEEIRDYVKQRVAAYKYPRRVWIADDLPKTSTGKILKREIEIPES
jgi:long-chain acyl-CoA synthetase